MNEKIISKIKTRFAPSPTGGLHLGNVRTALFSALYAHHSQGTFLLRVEDTDAARSKSEFTELLLDDLRWLGLDWQEGPDVGGEHYPYLQSQRMEIYQSHYHSLLESRKAYPCFCSSEELEISRKRQLASGLPPRYEGVCARIPLEEANQRCASGEKYTLRYRVPHNHEVVFEDAVKGHQRFDSKHIGDFIIRRADGTPAFFFCNAIDDALMGVTLVLRGEDHLTNTPRQIMLLESLNLPVPQYGHLPLLVGEDGAPLSKRHGAQTLHQLQDLGYVPKAIVNYLSRLGHSYEDDSLMTMSDLARNFSLQRIGKSAARFDLSQLDYWQRKTLSEMSTINFEQWLGKIPQLSDIHDLDSFIRVVRDNVTLWADVKHYIDLIIDADLVYPNEVTEILTQTDPALFENALKILSDSGNDFQQFSKQLSEQTGYKGKKLFQPLRAALTGQLHGPEMKNLYPLIPEEFRRNRLNKAHEYTLDGACHG